MESLAKRIFKKLLPFRMRLLCKKVYYYGNAFSCPICKASVRKLFPAGYRHDINKKLEVIGSGYRQNDACPVCGSQSRTRLLHRFLVHEILIENNRKKVLHFAPEFGLSLMFKQLDGIEYVPADIDPKRYSHLELVERIDATDVQFPDNTFDLILCDHVLEHIPDDAKAMAELQRVLHPDGMAILQVPISAKLEETIEDPTVTDPKERERRFGQSDHVRIYGQDYYRRLERAGFKVTKFNGVRAWGGQVIKKYRLDYRETITIARKITH